MENCIEDYESAQLLRDLILHRMTQEAEADRIGLGISTYYEEGGTRYEFLVGNSRFLRVRASFEVDGAMGDCNLLLMSYTGPTTQLLSILPAQHQAMTRHNPPAQVKYIQMLFILPDSWWVAQKGK